MSDYSISFNVYGAGNGSYTGHMNVTFKGRGMVPVTIGANQNAVGPGLAVRGWGNTADGVIQREDSFLSTREHVTRSVPVTKQQFELIFSAAKSQVGQPYDYAVFGNFSNPSQICGVSSICSKARERFSRLRMLIFLVLFVAVPQHSFANKNSHACPAVWQGYVQNIRAQIGSIHLPYPLLFVSRAGDVYDCLGLVGNKKFLEMASLYQKTLPLDRSSIITPDPATWPVNICTGGSAAWPTLTRYFTISLPLQADVLETNSCRVRILRSVRHLIEEIENGK